MAPRLEGAWDSGRGQRKGGRRGRAEGLGTSPCSSVGSKGSPRGLGWARGCRELIEACSLRGGSGAGSGRELVGAGAGQLGRCSPTRPCLLLPFLWSQRATQFFSPCRPRTPGRKQRECARLTPGGALVIGGQRTRPRRIQPTPGSPAMTRALRLGEGRAPGRQGGDLPSALPPAAGSYFINRKQFPT